jgi:hypothetical protein
MAAGGTSMSAPRAAAAGDGRVLIEFRTEDAYERWVMYEASRFRESAAIFKAWARGPPHGPGSQT